MRMPRVWFTVRGMMLAVAVVGLGLWIAERHIRFIRLRDFYADQQMRQIIMTPPAPPGVRSMHLDEKSRWCHELSVNYADAASYPWLPVAPDPPEPE